MVKESDQFKTTFAMPWGTYVYLRMSFGLTKVGATFQRAINVAFYDIINIFLVVYQDDLTTYSKKEGDHYDHLEKIFNKAIEYGISLNPKKCSFGVIEGRRLG